MRKASYRANNNIWLQRKHVRELLGCSDTLIDKLETTGELVPAMRRGSHGLKLWARADVEKLMKRWMLEAKISRIQAVK